MSQEKLVRSPFTINKNTDGASWISADLADVSVFTTILSYSVPLGVAIEITPKNYHFGQYKFTDGTKIVDGDTRILKQNANATESREVWAGSNGIFKDIGDAFQRPNLTAGVMVSTSEKLVIQVKGLGATLDKDLSNYYIECVQIYQEI